MNCKISIKRSNTQKSLLNVYKKSKLKKKLLKIVIKKSKIWKNKLQYLKYNEKLYEILTFYWIGKNN